MSKIFIDANILVYCMDHHDPAKQKASRLLLQTLAKNVLIFWAQAERQYLQELVMLTRSDVKEALRRSKLSRSRFYGLIKKYNITILS